MKDFTKLKNLIEQELANDKIVVDSIVMEEENKYLFLKIVLDKIGGLDLDTIVEATHKINPIVDNYDIKEENYILDISSKERKSSNE